jgi:hypothetical protein
MSWFRKSPAPEPEPEPTPPDDSAAALAAMKEAQLAFNKASAEKQTYERQSLNYGWRIINEQRVFLHNDDPVRLAFSIKAGRAWDDWQRKTRIWSDLKDRSNETVFVAGVLQR